MCPYLSVRRYLSITYQFFIPLVIASGSSWGGIMDGSYSIDDYRNFAENKGKYDINASGVIVTDKDGNQVGKIEQIMNFDSAIDVWGGSSSSSSGEGALVGGPSFIAGVAHDFKQNSVSFTQRFGAVGGTVYSDVYKVISAHQGDTKINPEGQVTIPEGPVRDFRVSRLSKIVTEASWTDYYTGDVASLIGETVQRVGGGQQWVVNEDGTTQEVSSAYQWLSGGQFEITNGKTNSADLSKVPTNGEGWNYDAIEFSGGYASSDVPLRNPSTAGDSGSAVWWYDKQAEKWLYLGATITGSPTPGANASSKFVGANEWAVSVIDGYNQLVATNSDDVITWKSGMEAGDGKPLHTAESTFSIGGETFIYTTLANGMRGDTSTSGSRASDEALDACNNIVFSGSGNNTIEIQGSIDTGAGYLEFATDFTLSSSSSSYRLNTAGWVLNKNVTLTSKLTGSAGDEWRMVGDGIVKIEGSGNNSADLNVGGTLLVELNRTGGYASRNIKLNGGMAMVRLVGDGSQIGGNIIFGHRGGTLDLYGHDLLNDQAFVGFEKEGELPSGNYIAAMDSGARIANLKHNSESTFTYVSKSSSTFVGSFADDAANGALLHILYDGGAGAWTLTGEQRNAGTWTVKSGNLVFQGKLDDYHGNTDDYNIALLDSGLVSVKRGAVLTAGAHSRIDSDMVIEGTLKVEAQSSVNGAIALDGGAIAASVSGSEARIEGLISGAGGIAKTGSGMLVLANAANSFAGGGTIAGGIVLAESAGALGMGKWDIQQSGTLFADVSQWDTYKSKVASSSTGTIGLAGDAINAASINMSGLASMSLGAVGNASIGTAGTSSTLSGWTADAGYRFGGGSGELTIYAGLTGRGTVEIGKDSVVILAGNNEGYSGSIVINSGSGLVMSGTNLMSQISSSSGGTLLVRGNVADDYDFTNKLGLRFGSDTEATYSGVLGGGNYKFGGSGILRLVSQISGSAEIQSGKHIWLNSSNQVSGTINVRGGAILQVGEGDTGGSVGTGTVNLDDGGTFVFNSNKDIRIETVIKGTGLSTVEKQGMGTAILTQDSDYRSKTIVRQGSLQLGDGGMAGNVRQGGQIDLYDGTQLIVNRRNDVILSGNIYGAGGHAKVIKEGEGTLTLSHYNNTYTGGTFVRKGILKIGADGYAAGKGTIYLEGGTLDVNGKIIENAIAVTKSGSSILNYSSSYRGTITAGADFRMQGGFSAENTKVIAQAGSIVTFFQNLGSTTTLNSLDYLNGGISFDLSGQWESLASGTSKSYTLLIVNGQLSHGALSSLSWTGTTLSSDYSTAFSQNGNSIILTLTNSGPERPVLVWQGGDGSAGDGVWGAGVSSWHAESDSSGVPLAFQTNDKVIFDGGAFTKGSIILQESVTPESIRVQSGDYILTGNGHLSGPGDLTVDGGALALAVDNAAYSGDFRLNGGVLGIAHENALGTGAIVFNGGTLRYEDRVSTDISGQIDRSVLSASNRANVDLNGNTVTWQSGVDFLNITNSKTGSEAVLVYGGAVLNGSGASATGYNFHIGEGAILRSVSGMLANVSEKNGLTLSGSGTFEAFISNGSHVAAIGDISNFSGTIRNLSQGAKILFTGGNNANSRFSLDTGTAGVYFSSLSETTYYLNSLSGSGSIFFTQPLSGGASNIVRHISLEMKENNAWSGMCQAGMNSGVFEVSSEGDAIRTLALSMPQSSPNLKLRIKNATVQFSGVSSWGGTISIDSKGKLDFANSSNITQRTVISGEGSVAVNASSAATITLSAANTYKGGTVVESGTLKAGHVNAFGSGTVALKGGTLDMAGLILANDVDFSGGSLSNYGKYAGALVVNADMTLTGKLGEGKASISIASGSSLTWQNSLDWYGANTLDLAGISNSGTLYFDFTGTVGTLGSEQFWKLMELTDRNQTMNFGSFDWIKSSLSIADGYTAGLSAVDGVLSFVVTRQPAIDSNGDVVQNYTPGAGDITDIRNINGGAAVTVQSGVSLTVRGDVSGSASVAGGGSIDFVDDSIVTGDILVNGGAMQVGADKFMSISDSGKLVLQDGAGTDLITVRASSEAQERQSLSGGVAARTESANSASLSGVCQNTSIEFKKSEAELVVRAGDKLALDKSSSISNASGVSNTSVSIAGELNNHSGKAIDVDIHVKNGGILSGTGIYNNKIDVDAGGSMRVGDSPGIVTASDLHLSGQSMLDFAINGNQPATTGGWSDSGHSHLIVNGTLSLDAYAQINLEIGREYFNSIATQTGQSDYALIYFSNSAFVEFGGVIYNLSAAEEIQAWFDDMVNCNFVSYGQESLSDWSDVAFKGFEYDYNASTGTATLNVSLGYGKGDAVPEPSSLILIMAGCAAFVLRRRRR